MIVPFWYVLRGMCGFKPSDAELNNSNSCKRMLGKQFNWQGQAVFSLSLVGSGTGPGPNSVSFCQ